MRGLDLFGMPVQLTHQGQRTYKTGLGGCVSLILILALVAMAITQFNQVYYYPEFKALPPDYDFSQREVTLSYEQSTIALGVVIKDSNSNFTSQYAN